MAIEAVAKGKKRFLELLLLADEQESMIDRYLERGDMFVLREGGKAIAECVVTDEGDGIFELKSLAVAAHRQRQGFGRAMIDFLVCHYQGRMQKLRVGTGDSPLTIPFYEHCGFRKTGLIPGFFTENYDHPITEGGTVLRDMVVLEKETGLPRLENLRLRLSGRIHQADICEICLIAQSDVPTREALCGLLTDSTPRVAENAAWVLTHLPAAGRGCLLPRRGKLMDLAMQTGSQTLCRLLLTLLNALPLPEETRTDFLDFCFSRSLSASAPSGIRALCIKLAHAQSLPYPELLDELRQLLEMMEPELLSPAIRSVRRNTLRAISQGTGQHARKKLPSNKAVAPTQE